MKLLRPLPISDAALTSSNVTEDDHAPWSAGTTYALGAKCIRTQTHRVYESALAGNLGNVPETTLTGASPKWIDIGPTNRWAMFDARVGTQTAAIESIAVTVRPGRCNGLALMQIDASWVSVVLRVAGAVVFERSESLLVDSVVDWYGYFFNPIVRKADWVITDLPMFADADITVQLTGAAGSQVGCGECVCGTLAFIGHTRPGPLVGIRDFSKKEVDVFGNPQIIQRGYSKRASVSLWLPSQLVDATVQTLAEIRALPVVWIGADNRYTSLLVYGFYRDFEIDLSTGGVSYASLSIEGLI